MRRAALLTVVAAVLLQTPRGAFGSTEPPSPLPDRLHVEVTGDPAPPETLRLAIVTTLRTQVPRLRDARLDLEGTTPPLAPLPPSSEITVQARLAASAPGDVVRVRAVPVVLTNTVLPWSDAEVLLVSNSPESLPFGKVLYLGALAAPQTVRLLYHHRNGSRTRHLFLTVGLSNPARRPVRLWVSAASGGPETDEVIAGHAAASRFLDQYWHRAGFLVAIPANTTVPLCLHDLPPQAAVSGLAQMALIDGERLNILVTARLEGEMDPPTVSYEPDFDRSHQRGAFAHPQIAHFLAYTVGGPSLTMTLGDTADLLREGGTGVPLSGNYGVMYTFVVQVANPTSAPAVVALAMHADGGEARGTFLVDGTVLASPVVKPNAPQVLTAVRLDPEARRTLRISTMPESASNYPVRLTLGPP
jgi:hypothetical protein